MQYAGFLMQQYFNSQPRKEADLLVVVIVAPENSISIHSLARRLTLNTICIIDGIYISIHSLARRLTPILCRIFTSSVFQFTASQGG